MSAVFILQSLISGILMGGIYALLGVGFSLTWGVLRVINIAHAAFGVLAAYIAYWFSAKLFLDPLLSLVISLPCLFFGGMILHRGLIRPITKARDTIVSSMVLTFGLAIVLENVMLWLWKADPRVLNPSYSGTAIFIGEVALPIPQVIAFGLAVVGISLIYLFLNQTRLGGGYGRLSDRLSLPEAARALFCSDHFMLCLRGSYGHSEYRNFRRGRRPLAAGHGEADLLYPGGFL